jgi:hypothetical protein
MKGKLLLAGLIAVIFILSCKKDNADTGAIRYSNFSTAGHRYQIFLDGKSLGLLDAGHYYDKSPVTVGSHTVKATQYEGIVVTPIIIERTMTVAKDDTSQFQFP